MTSQLSDSYTILNVLQRRINDMARTSPEFRDKPRLEAPAAEFDEMLSILGHKSAVFAPPTAPNDVPRDRQAIFFCNTWVTRAP